MNGRFGESVGHAKGVASIMSNRSAENIHVAVLKGGWSAEREVSLVSGAACAEALRGEGFHVTEVDVDRSIAQTLAELKPDVVFNALHGPYGEDGTIQGILEVLDLPYTHSGVLASALAMDKARAKAIYRDVGVPVEDSFVVDRAAAAQSHQMDPPYVVKPIAEGSSFGIHIVPTGANSPPKELAEGSWSHGDKVMVEKYVPGRELTVAVMGDRALAVTEIISNTTWYDFEAKYAEGGSSHIIPADIPSNIYNKCLDIALKAHEALGCRGISRTDFRYDDTGEGPERLIVLETNTQPGMTPTSLAPEQAAHVGMSFGALVRWLVEDASCGR